MRVSSAEFIKSYGALADKALVEAVTITRNGRDRLVLVSAEEYARLKARDRQIIALEDYTEQDLKQLASMRVADTHAALDAELADWTP